MNSIDEYNFKNWLKENIKKQENRLEKYRPECEKWNVLASSKNTLEAVLKKVESFTELNKNDNRN